MAKIKSLHKLIAERLIIYRRWVRDRSLFPKVNGRRLTPFAGNRQRNFVKFVDLYFSKQVSKPPGWGEMKQATKLTKKSDGYKAFNKFALTDYGSSVINEMITHRKKYLEDKFTIMENTGLGAHGDYSAMTFPKKFPKAGGRFSARGQKIYDLAIIYHEFAHTMVFRSKISKNINITIRDERIAVMKFENPVRMKKGMEPRFTYAQLNDSGVVIKTINIATGEVKSGGWTVSKFDPTILVKPSHKDAL